MDVSRPRKDTWLAIIVGLLFYAGSAFYVHRYYGWKLSDLLPSLLIVGLGFTLIAYQLTRRLRQTPGRSWKAIEIVLLLFLIGWIATYITYGGDWIDQLLPKAWITDERIYSWVVLFRKLLVFVAIPFLVYQILGFRWNDFGGKVRSFRLFSLPGWIILIIFGSLAILFQLYFSRAGKEISDHPLTIHQWLAGGGLGLIWLIFEAGVVEEFFFRVLLQSRLEAATRSPAIAIVATSLIFGLTHAPGLYLRGAEGEGLEISFTFIFFAAYTILYMSVAGLFLSMLWHRTRSFWLVVIVHALVDWLPFLHGFCKTWNIR